MPLFSFSRADSQIVKGVAVLLMIMHHTLIPAFYNSPPDVLNNAAVTRLMIGGKFCVGLFAFVTGYGYACSSAHGWSYSWKHILRLLLRYWFLMFVLFIPLSMMGGGNYDVNMIVLNMVGLKSSMNCANWYVYFYVFSMLALPIVARIFDRYNNKAFLVSILVCMAGYLLGEKTGGMWGDALMCCTKYLPVVEVGYLVATCQNEKFRSLKSFFNINSPVLYLLLAIIVFMIRCGIAGVGVLTSDIILAPAFVYCIAKMDKAGLFSPVKHVLLLFGRYSFYIWFIHAMFFSTTTRSLFQDSAFWPNKLLLVYALVTSISLVIAIALMIIDDSITKVIARNKHDQGHHY